MSLIGPRPDPLDDMDIYTEHQNHMVVYDCLNCPIIVDTRLSYSWTIQEIINNKYF